MATPVDPILTAIERDRIAYVAFAASSTRPMDGRQHRKKVAKSHKPMRTLTKPPAASGRMLLVNLRMTAFGVRGRRAVLPLAAREDPQCSGRRFGPLHAGSVRSSIRRARRVQPNLAPTRWTVPSSTDPQSQASLHDFDPVRLGEASAPTNPGGIVDPDFICAADAPFLSASTMLRKLVRIQSVLMVVEETGDSRLQ